MNRLFLCTLCMACESVCAQLNLVAVRVCEAYAAFSIRAGARVNIFSFPALISILMSGEKNFLCVRLINIHKLHKLHKAPSILGFSFSKGAQRYAQALHK